MMNLTKNLRLFLGLVIIFLSCLTIRAAQAEEINPLANPSQLVFYESGVTTEVEHQAIIQAAQLWNSLAGRPVIVVNIPQQRVDFIITPVLGYDEGETLAVTYRLYNTRYISYLMALRSDPVMLRRVLTHEMGHALGLNHSKNKKSVMYAYYNGADFPDTVDVAKVRSMWTF